jgi:hypothetical protein
MTSKRDDGRPLSSKDVREIFAEFERAGEIVQMHDADGKPVFRRARSGELQPVYVLARKH